MNLAEAPPPVGSPQAAVRLVERYFALIGQRRFGEAWRLWSDGGRANGLSQAAFAASFDRYRDFRARIGAPGEIEGTAGSLYVSIPVQASGRLRNGRPFDMEGPVTLRRVNDVPGSTPEQRRWHIVESDLRLGPSP